MYLNPDRDFGTNLTNPEEHDVRVLLPRSPIADIFDQVIRERVGKLIGRAAFRPAKPGRSNDAAD